MKVSQRHGSRDLQRPFFLSSSRRASAATLRRYRQKVHKLHSYWQSFITTILHLAFSTERLMSFKMTSQVLRRGPRSSMMRSPLHAANPITPIRSANSIHQYLQSHSPHAHQTRSITQLPSPRSYRVPRRTPRISRNNDPLPDEIPTAPLERLKFAWQAAKVRNPIAFRVSLLLAIGSVVSLIGLTTYMSIFGDPTEHKFPESVARHLRQGLLYGTYHPDPQRSLEAYRAALRAAEQEGMHMWSDEVFGIKSTLADMLEKNGRFKSAVKVLEQIKTEGLQWIEARRLRQAILEREWKAANPGKPLPEPEDIAWPYRAIKDPSATEESKKTVTAPKSKSSSNEEPSPELNDNTLPYILGESAQRDRLLGRLLGVQVKIAELQSSPYLSSPSKATTELNNVLALYFKEFRRRESLNLPGLHESWFSRDSAIALLSRIGELFTELNEPSNAVTIWSQALRLTQEEDKDLALKHSADHNITQVNQGTSCRQVLLSAHIATAMTTLVVENAVLSADAKRKAASKKLPTSQKPNYDNTEIARNGPKIAKSWAQQALKMADAIPRTEASSVPFVRDESCDIGCAEALSALAELAAAENDYSTAITFSQKAKEVASAGFEGSEAIIASSDEMIRQWGLATSATKKK